jgi:hypothetical protein
MPTRATSTRPSTGLRAAFIAALLALLVLAQTLGALHRVAHAGGDGAAASGNWVLDLFAGHDHDGSCELFDQLTHGDALCSASPPAMPSQSPGEPATRHAAWQIAAQAAGFLARGPPLLS